VRAVLYEVVVRYGTVLNTASVLHKELFALYFTAAGSTQCTFSQHISSIGRCTFISSKAVALPYGSVKYVDL
jgi:hypothetical protein